MLIRRFMHRATFSDPTKGKLQDLGREVRAGTWRILHLPKDNPKAAFHASVAGGGPGGDVLCDIHPSLDKIQIRRLAEAEGEAVTAVAIETLRPTTVPSKVWGGQLHDTVD